MKVKELRKLLKKVDPEAEVSMVDSDEFIHDVKSIEEDTRFKMVILKEN